MEYKTLSIFTHHGHTYTFRNIHIICNNETTLQFNYVGMSDGQTKIANFPKANIAGCSVTPKDE